MSAWAYATWEGLFAGAAAATASATATAKRRNKTRGEMNRIEERSWKVKHGNKGHYSPKHNTMTLPDNGFLGICVGFSVRQMFTSMTLEKRHT